MSDNLKLSQGGSFALTSGALAEGTNDGTYKTTATVTFVIDGVFKSKAGTDNLAFSTGHTPVGPGKSCLFLICLNANGDASTVQGLAVTTADVTAGAVSLQWPSAPNNAAVIGAVRVDTNASTTFTPGTTDLGAAGITDTFFNLFSVPTAPLTA
jgi:hypothetical protein